MGNTPIPRSAAATLRWRSFLGISVGLFLAWGLLNAALAIYVPYTLHTGGPAALGGLILTAEVDEALLGRTYASIDAQDPRLAAYLVAFMDTMCAQMMAFAVAYIAVVWFGLRRGGGWALWVAALAGGVVYAYYLPILGLYASYSVPTGVFAPLFAVPLTALIIATALGWTGLRRARIRPLGVPAPDVGVDGRR
jgi:hypothetical protein